MKIVFVSSMLPTGHYSQYLTAGLSSLPNADLVVYADQDPRNTSIRGCGRVKAVWSRSPAYIVQIVRELQNDKPDVVHVQHELNMYGGFVTALLFPVLLLLVRIMGYKVVVTVHAAVYKKQVDEEFIELFHKSAWLFRPFLLKIFFICVFKSISWFSNRIVVHTRLKKDILSADYGVDVSKIEVIPISIPRRSANGAVKEKYFFYFGYMVRRKGLGFVLDGFKRFVEKYPKTTYNLVLAGGVIGGQERALTEIEEMISKNILQDRVWIRGFVDEKDLDGLYGKAEAVVIPAKVSMGSSGPLFHAISYGKCVIASNVGHFVEDIDNLKTGILTDNDRWDDAFRLVVENPGLVRQIEDNTREKALARTPSAIAQRYVDAYSRLR